MDKVPQQPCAECKRYFELRALNQLYCSLACKTKAERKRRRDRNRGLIDALRGVPGVKDPTAAALELLVSVIEAAPRTTQFEVERPPQGWQPPHGFVLTEKWNPETNTVEPNKFLLNHETLGT